MTRKQMCVGAAVGGSLLAAAVVNAAVTGLTTTQVDFSNGYLLADGTVHAASQAEVSAAWADFSESWDVYRLWVTVDSPLTALIGLGGTADFSMDFILDAGAGGVFYNHPVFDSDVSQDPDDFVASPTRAFDTFATIGVADGSLSPLITEFNNAFDGFQSSVACEICGWSVTPSPGQGVVSDGEGGLRILVGQFTVTEGSLFNSFAPLIGASGADGVDVVSAGTNNIPVPPAFAVFAIAAINPRITRTSRRRRR